MTPIPDDVVEAGARVVAEEQWPGVVWEELPPGWRAIAISIARACLTAALPAIRAAALEEAAGAVQRVADEGVRGCNPVLVVGYVLTAIRALKEPT